MEFSLTIFKDVKWKYFLWLLSGLLTFSGVEAAHLVGGEMSYTCLGNGQYLIRLKIFRDCNSTGAPFDDSVSVAAFDPLDGSPFATPLEEVYLTHGQIVQLPTSLNNPCLQVPPGVCTEFTVYEGSMNLPPRNGGYLLSHQRCCRNSTLSNIPNPGSWGNTFIANIPANDVACNSSPRFNDNPPVVLCQNDSLEFDHAATEGDGDSLYYSLCDAFHGGTQNDPAPQPSSPPPYTPIPFTAGFGPTNPMPASPPIAIDGQSGMLRGRPTAAGQYLFTVCVEEYRNGQLLSTVRRDFQFNVTPCQSTVISAITPQSDLPSTICNGTTVQFTHNSQGGAFYRWEFNDPGNPNGFSVQSTPTYTFSDTGDYVVRLIVNPGTVCADTSEEIFTLHYPLDPEISLTGDLCFDTQQLNLRVSGNFSQNADVSWTFNGQTFNSFVFDPGTLGTLGPYWAFVEVREHDCVGVDSLQFNLFEPPTIFGQLGMFSGCAPFTLQLSDSIQSNPFTRHFWQFGDGNTSDSVSPVHTYTSPGTYDVLHVMWSDTGCVDSVWAFYPAAVTVLPSPEAILEVDKQEASIYKPFFTFRDSSMSNIVFQRTTMGDGTIYENQQTWVHAYSDTGNYRVVHLVENSSGCLDSLTFFLRVKPVFKVFAPTAFRPDGNGLNEEFRIYGSGWKKMELRIFSRWGEQVFFTIDGSKGWNGRWQNSGETVPEGVYTWQFKAEGEEGEVEERFGTVMLMR